MKNKYFIAMTVAGEGPIGAINIKELFIHGKSMFGGYTNFTASWNILNDVILIEANED